VVGFLADLILADLASADDLQGDLAVAIRAPQLN
jgi:hypothetical protein